MSCLLAVLCATLWLSTAPPIVVAADTSPAVTDTTGFAHQRPVALQRIVADDVSDTTVRRKAVVISEWYERRLTVHRYGSYAMLPLFLGEFLLGQQILTQKDGIFDGSRREPINASLRNTHRTVAYGLSALFAVNTTTGLWNLWDARHDGSSNARRTLHVLSMLGADAGFAFAGTMAAQRAVNGRPSDARAHRNIALASMGLSTVGVALMWF